MDRLGDLLLCRRSRCGARRRGSSPASSPTATKGPRQSGCGAPSVATISRMRASFSARTPLLISWKDGDRVARRDRRRPRRRAPATFCSRKRGGEVDALLAEAALLEDERPARRGAVAGRVLGDDVDLGLGRASRAIAKRAKRRPARGASGPAAPSPGNGKPGEEDPGHLDSVAHDGLGERVDDGARAAAAHVGEAALDRDHAAA